jgi:transcriptional regulator with XRE-family HTH domain
MGVVEHPLRAWRVRNSVSLRALAAKLRCPSCGDVVSPSSLVRIEQGIQPPSVAVMRAILLATDGEVTPNDLVAAYRPRTAVPTNSDPTDS